MSSYITLAIIAIIVAMAIYKRHRTYADIVVPDSGVRRADLLYGYYACMGDQAAEVADHVTLHHESQFDGLEKAVDNILKLHRTTALDVSYQVFSAYVPGVHRTIRPDAAQRLRDFFTLLYSKGALQYVKFLYPIDEPNNTVGSAEVLAAAVALVKQVAGGFKDLDGVRYAVIYAADKPFICQDLYDLVGFDDYDKKSSVLTGQYQKLKVSLRPGQQTILVPGGCYGQDPTPFINFAQANKEVGIVMPFLWYDDPWGNVKALGIRSQPAMRAAYTAAGLSITRGALG
jgi:hypothetical protein